MKLLSLNVWAGTRIDSLLEYLAAEAPATDIFCFQEVIDGPPGYGDIGSGYRADTYTRIKTGLPGFVPFYAPAEKDVRELLVPSPVPVSFGQATFVRSSFDVMEHGVLWVTDPAMTVNQENRYVRPRCMQHLTLKTPNGALMIGNLHGVIDGGRKDDSPDRTKQFQLIADFFARIGHPKILCGDFNARPETKSLGLLEPDMTNLVRTHNITVTRTHWYPGLAEYGDAVSDYIFTSPQVAVIKFDVPSVTEISDHLPLVLEFSLDK